MSKPVSYYEQKNMDYTTKLREVLAELPAFCRDFFRAMEPKTQPKTRISYAYDLRIFFNFLIEKNPVFKDYALADFKLSDLDKLQAVDIEEYEEYLKLYDASGDKTITNTEKGLARKMSSLRSFYNYYFKHLMITTNPPMQVAMPKLHQKAIIRLDVDEVAELLDYIENCGESLSGQKKVYYEKTKYRDLALITLLLGTGIRVSECVGLDMNDVDFKNNSIKVTRKGGNQMYVYFGNEVENALYDYLNQTRLHTTPLPGYENALFLSMQRKRISVRSVEELVHKYSMQVTPNKHITPHKFRSTYGTNLYRETGDIYLVADVLGHKDVNTTKKHYADMGDDRRRMAASAVILREKREEKVTLKDNI